MMKKLSLWLGLVSIFLAFNLSSFASDINLGISLGDGKLRSFYFSLSDYYRIPEEQIIIIKKRYPIIVEEELPVILLIVREAGVSPDVIVELRRKGYSWYDILIRFRIYPEVVFKRYIIYGPPYGKAWGYHKKKKVVFVDDDIIFLSNVKFLSEYYREVPDVVIKYKEKHPRFVDVHYEIYEHKKGEREKFKEKEEKEFRERDREQRDYRDSKDYMNQKDKDFYNEKEGKGPKEKHRGKKEKD
jgi:hypothetical protein